MDKIFASLFEWLGLNPLYSTDMAEYLSGWDITCSCYCDRNWYVLIGWIMIIITSLVYALQYHIIDSSRWNKKQHWWIFALLIVVLNFLVAFTIPFNTVNASDYCDQLNLSISDCIGFGISNAIWSFILFLIMSTIPLIRRFSTNCRNTTFWKP